MNLPESAEEPPQPDQTIPHDEYLKNQARSTALQDVHHPIQEADQGTGGAAHQSNETREESHCQLVAQAMDIARYHDPPPGNLRLPVAIRAIANLNYASSR